MKQIKVTRKTHVTDGSIDLKPGVYDVSKDGPVTLELAKLLIGKNWARELNKDEASEGKKAK